MVSAMIVPVIVALAIRSKNLGHVIPALASIPGSIDISEK